MMIVETALAEAGAIPMPTAKAPAVKDSARSKRSRRRGVPVVSAVTASGVWRGGKTLKRAALACDQASQALCEAARSAGSLDDITASVLVIMRGKASDSTPPPNTTSTASDGSAVSRQH